MRAASINVTILPAAAASASGQWRIDNGPWQRSGLTVRDIPAGAHTLSCFAYGWNRLPVETLKLSAGDELVIARELTPAPMYALIGLVPSAGKYRVDGGNWVAGGATSYMPAGSHIIEYLPLPDLESPIPEIISGEQGSGYATTSYYVVARPTHAARPASLKVVLSGPAARWNLDDGPWQAGGATASGLVAGEHTLRYSELPGWTGPTPESLTLEPGDALVIARDYRPAAKPPLDAALPASLKVDLSRAEVRWRLDGGAWQPGGATVGGIVAGTHSITYSVASGWTPPDTESLTLAPGETLAITRDYTLAPMQVLVHLIPPTGKYRLNGGAWVDSGVSSCPPAGNYVVEYSPLPDLEPPASEIVSGEPGSSVDRTRSYTALGSKQNVGWSASLAVKLSPATAEWHLDDGPWYASGTGVTGLDVGMHTLSFSALPGWTAPAAESVTLAPGYTPEIAREYTPAPMQVLISLVPSCGRYRLNGGAWVDSGAVSSSPAGTCRIEYSPLPDLQPPPGETITGEAGDTFATTRYYASSKPSLDTGAPASLKTVFSPPIARLRPEGDASRPANSKSRAGMPASLKVDLIPTAALWKLDGDAWRASGETVTGLLAGQHNIRFSACGGWVNPEEESVTVSPGDALVITREYATAPMQISISLVPAAGKYRLDGGAWIASGEKSFVPAGTCLVEYSPLPGLESPASEVLTFSAGTSFGTTRRYTPGRSKTRAGLAALLKVKLSPADAKWSLDGGASKPAGAAIDGIAAGPHTIKYSVPPGWTPPSEETIVLAPGDARIIDRNCTPDQPDVHAGPPAALTMILVPSEAQWNLDGGDWHPAGATVDGISPGPHTLRYTVATRATPPTEERLTLEPENGRVIVRDCSKDPTQVLIALVPSTGKYRLNGGAWVNSGVTSWPPAGTCRVDYLPLPDLDPPATETITCEAGGTFAATRRYTSAKPTLRVVFAPPLGPALGKWRLDGGAWQVSGATLTGLDAGNHRLEYSDIGGDFDPLPVETLTLPERKHLSLSRTYKYKRSSFQVNLTPSSAQWRISASEGEWLPSGHCWKFWGLRSFSVQYSYVEGYASPPIESIVVTPGQNVVLTRAYGARPDRPPAQKPGPSAQ